MYCSYSVLRLRAKCVFDVYQFPKRVLIPPVPEMCLSISRTFQLLGSVFSSFQFPHGPETCSPVFQFPAQGQTCFNVFSLWPLRQTCYVCFQFPVRGQPCFVFLFSCFRCPVVRAPRTCFSVIAERVLCFYVFSYWPNVFSCSLCFHKY